MLEIISNRSELRSSAEDALFSLYSRSRSLSFMRTICISAYPLPHMYQGKRFDNGTPLFYYLDNLARSLLYGASPKRSLSWVGWCGTWRADQACSAGFTLKIVYGISIEAFTEFRSSKHLLTTALYRINSLFDNLEASIYTYQVLKCFRAYNLRVDNIF